MVIGCGASAGEPRSAPTVPAPAPPPAPAPASPIDERFAAAIRTAQANAATSRRLDEQARLAPELCAPAAVAGPAPKLSLAERGPHGRKLYFLIASDPVAYRDPATVPVGFAVVKESFAALPAPAGSSAAAHGPDGAGLVLGERKDWFVMTKVAADAADGTDAGWVYGTVTADGTLTSAGRVASCMGCHDDKPSRLFGVAKI